MSLALFGGRVRESRRRHASAAYESVTNLTASGLWRSFRRLSVVCAGAAPYDAASHAVLVTPYTYVCSHIISSCGCADGRVPWMMPAQRLLACWRHACWARASWAARGVPRPDASLGGGRPARRRWWGCAVRLRVSARAPLRLAGWRRRNCLRWRWPLSFAARLTLDGESFPIGLSRPSLPCGALFLAWRPLARWSTAWGAVAFSGS